MAKKQLQLTYALKNERIVSIEDVESGLKCGCICPACGEPLVAKKGAKMMHHFAHHTGQNCEYGYESSLHLAAKDILLNAQKMVIPAVKVTFSDSYKTDQLICAAQEIQIERVELEKRYGGIVPDIVVYAGGKILFVEIYVTHKIDDQKLKKLRTAGISTIEIDLSKKQETIARTELETLLLQDSEEKRWKFNVVSEKYLKRFYDISDKKEIIKRGLALHVDDCPIRTRMWRGKSYANFMDDCLYCEYCISTKRRDEILCSGRHRVATVKDFDIPEERRIRESDELIEDRKEREIDLGICPNCGGTLVERQSEYGKFKGCSRYPHCRFRVYRDKRTGRLVRRT